MQKTSHQIHLTPIQTQAKEYHVRQETNGQQKARLTCIQMSVVNIIHVHGLCNLWKLFHIHPLKNLEKTQSKLNFS